MIINILLQQYKSIHKYHILTYHIWINRNRGKHINITSWVNTIQYSSICTCTGLRHWIQSIWYHTATIDWGHPVGDALVPRVINPQWHRRKPEPCIGPRCHFWFYISYQPMPGPESVERSHSSLPDLEFFHRPMFSTNATCLSQTPGLLELAH